MAHAGDIGTILGFTPAWSALGVVDQAFLERAKTECGDVTTRSRQTGDVSRLGGLPQTGVQFLPRQLVSGGLPQTLGRFYPGD